MELRILRYFLMVVQEQNISRASERLHISQPTVSRQLKDLEDELGITLFERGSRTIQLTEEGQYLADQARQILALTDKTLDNIHKEKDISGSVYIGSAESKMIITVAQSIHHLREIHPNILVNMISTDAINIKQKLENGVYDFGIVMEPFDKTDYDFVKLLGESSWGVLTLNSSPLAKKEYITLSDLEHLNLIISQQNGVRNLHQIFGLENENIHVAATYNLLYNASLMVSAGVGDALTLDGIINTNQSDLTFIPLKPRVTAGSTLIRLKGQRLSKAAQAIWDQVKSDI